MPVPSQSAPSVEPTDSDKTARARRRSRINRVLGGALGVSGLIGATTFVSALSLASPVAAQPVPPPITIVPYPGTHYVAPLTCWVSAIVCN